MSGFLGKCTFGALNCHRVGPTILTPPCCEEAKLRRGHTSICHSVCSQDIQAKALHVWIKKSSDDSSHGVISSHQIFAVKFPDDVGQRKAINSVEYYLRPVFPESSACGEILPPLLCQETTNWKGSSCPHIYQDKVLSILTHDSHNTHG